jgi:3-hydroxybutyryl-CoA dehydrogenase
MLDITKAGFSIGVAGVGAMGRGIAQIAAQAGFATTLFDAKEGVAASAKASIADSLDKLVQKGKLAAPALEATLANLRVAASLADLAQCDVVVEAIIERLDIKREFFVALEGVLRADAILATNTSSLSVTSIASALKHPGRMAGYHFFNPVPVMKVVEVIAGARTETWVTELLTALAKRMGHVPVNAADTPGFIVNHAGRAYTPEALRVLGEGIAPFYEVDRIMTKQAGFKIGPCALMDLVGFDVTHPVMESIYRQYYEEAKYRPSVIGQQKKDAGLLGRKTGQGFYTYVDGNAESMAFLKATGVKPPSVWVSSAHALGNAHLMGVLAGLGVAVNTGKPAPGELCLVTPFGQDCTTAALAEGLDPAHTVAVDALMPMHAGPNAHRTLMLNPATGAAARDAAHALFEADGGTASVIRDSAGFVAQRIIAQIVNIGCDIVQQRVCTPEDLDRAVMLGLGYPKGPLALGDAMGARNILAILDNMQHFYGDMRYRPSPWLKRRALLGLPLTTSD